MPDIQIILHIHNAFNIICRYDGDAKKLEHIKPLPQKLLQSLGGELDFLGPYPLNHSAFFCFQ